MSHPRPTSRLLIKEHQARTRTAHTVTAQKALEEMWRRYEFIVNNSKEYMTLVSREYVYEAVNESYCKALGKTREQIVGKTVADIWGEGVYLEKIKETFDESFSGKEVQFQGWLAYPMLGERYMHVTYYPYRTPEGIVTHTVVVSRDITERKQTEEALHQAHAQNEQLLASIPSILIGVGADDRITHLNRPAELAFGVTAKTVIGQSFLECGIQWDWFEVLTRIKAGCRGLRPTYLNEVKYTRPDSKEGFLNITTTPFVGDSSRQAGFLLVGEDVTERKILQSQLSQAQKLESIGQLAAGIAHEINTPTQYVGDNIRFLQESWGQIFALLTDYQALLQALQAGTTPPRQISQLEEALIEADVEFLKQEIPLAIQQSMEGVERVSGIVRAMKEFSHPGVEEKTAIDINRAIESTITVARNEWKYVAEMITDFDAHLPLVPCRPSEFNQVILNMIINAIHAIADVQKSGSGDKGTITINTRQDGAWVEIRISDTGTGIPEGIRSKIFDPFFTTKEVGQGTGQGLAISYAVIVEKHHGAITFETEMGKGTTFIIRLPLEPGLSAGTKNGQPEAYFVC
ncbi:MAG: PAS domain S-box protein [Anaerolineae bacterium]|nr:PAS domain S-box protein [Anaerolineae bacterium]